MFKLNKILDRESLSHCTFHWFWGLQYHKVIKPQNLENGLSKLLDDAAHKQTIDQKQAQILAKPFFIRIFYWIFNINNFTYEYYLSVIYKQFHSNFTADSNMQNSFEQNIEQSTLNKNPGFFRKLYASLLGQSHQQNNVSQETPVAPVENDAAIETAEDTFIISSGMQEHLKILGIDKANNDICTWHEIKKAFRDAARRTHPDKGGAPEAFPPVKRAFDLLYRLVFPESSSLENEIYSDFGVNFANFMKECDEIEKSFSEIRAEQKKMREDIEELRADQVFLNQKQDELEEEINKTKKTINLTGFYILLLWNDNYRKPSGYIESEPNSPVFSEEFTAQKEPQTVFFKRTQSEAHLSLCQSHETGNIIWSNNL